MRLHSLANELIRREPFGDCTWQYGASASYSFSEREKSPRSWPRTTSVSANSFTLVESLLEVVPVDALGVT